MKTNSIIVLALCSLIHFSVLGQQQSINIDEVLDNHIRDLQIEPNKRLSVKIYNDSASFEVKIIPDYFLLGTFSDYMGRFHYIDRETQVDIYYPAEETLAKYIVHFIEKNYSIKVDLQFEEPRGSSKIFSKPIAEKLHSYYDEKGKLKEGIFDTEEKMYSFLTGVLLRFGENVFDNIFEVHIYNSPKDKEIYQLLKTLECDKIIYKNYRGYIPNSDLFYFEATLRIIKYFNLIKNENEIIRYETTKSYKKRFGETFIQERDEHYKKLKSNIRSIFNE